MEESTKYLVFLMVLGSFGFGILVADLTNYDLVNKKTTVVEELNSFDRGAYCFDWFEIGWDAGEKDTQRENFFNNSILDLNELKERIVLYDRIYSCEQELKQKQPVWCATSSSSKFGVQTSCSDESGYINLNCSGNCFLMATETDDLNTWFYRKDQVSEELFLQQEKVCLGRDVNGVCGHWANKCDVTVCD